MRQLEDESSMPLHETIVIKACTDSPVSEKIGGYLTLENIFIRVRESIILKGYDLYGIDLQREDVAKILMSLGVSYHCNSTIINRTQKIFF